MARYDGASAAAFFDDYGEREWERFVDGRTPATSLATHVHYLRRFVNAGDRVLDVGCGPGRFTIELASLGARVVAADVSPGQIELHRGHVAAAGAESSVESRHVVDVLQLGCFADDSFDAVVCYGGVLSYVLERAPEALRELVRVTRPGGHVLVSVMSLVGATVSGSERVLEHARQHGATDVHAVVASGLLPSAASSGHLPMRLYRWRELDELLLGAGTLVAASATGLFPNTEDSDGARLLARLELDLGAEPGALDAGAHILAVVRV
ncbi:MAG TPA: class I SAM-dependent methyltransferase [Gaiellaceae bacterium]|nr:class I SAM-dependent methyltransferase [Gaiellaceae bacterium]